jgi:two-component system response regulator (stage 0 sporulation protein A)
MTELEMNVAALIRCVPADVFATALSDIRGEKPAPVNTNEDIETLATDLLVEMGVPGHLCGFDYIVAGARLIIRDPEMLRGITTDLYPSIADEHGTTPSRVERGIRHAIECMMDRVDIDAMEKYFGNSIDPEKGKPTNSEFIARVVHFVKKRIKEG